MLSSLLARFNGLIYDETAKNTVLEPKPTSFVYRDELGKKDPQIKIKPKLFNGDCFAAPKPRVGQKGLEKEKKEVVRVAIKMTKQEAERLLSKCREGGVLEFRHVANEIANIPVDRVNVVMAVCNEAKGCA